MNEYPLDAYEDGITPNDALNYEVFYAMQD